MARSRAKSIKSRRSPFLPPTPHVQLSKYDLTQLDDKVLAALSWEQLQRRSTKLLVDLKLAHEWLDQTPRNRSRPPSSQAPWECGASAEAGDDAPELQDRGTEAAPAPASAPSTDADPDPEVEQPAQPEAEAYAPSTADEASSDRRPGQRPGAPGHGRMQRVAIDQVVEHSPTRCTRCGAALPDALESACHHAHHVIDLRPLVAERHALEFETCRQRDHSPWAFIAETLTQRRRGQAVPALPAAD